MNAASRKREDVVHVQVHALPDGRPAEVADVRIGLPSKLAGPDDQAGEVIA